MKSLNRPMFRMGGRIINGPSGITAGFNQGGTVRQGFSDGGDEYLKTLIENQKLSEESLNARLAMMESEALPEDSVSGGFNPNMRLVELAGNIMSADSEGSGVKGLLKTFGKPLAGYAKGVYTDQDAVRERARQRQYDVDDLKLGMDATKYKLATESLSAYALKSVDKDEFERMQESVQKEQDYIMNLDPNTEDYQALIQQSKNRIGIALSGRLSPILSGMSDEEREDYMSDAKKAIASKYAIDVEMLSQKQLAEAQTYYNTVVYKAALAQLGIGLGYLDPIEEKADGGRVGMYMGGDPDIPNANPTPGFEPGSGPVQDPNQPPIMTAQTGQADPNKLTFQELRARLPMEVSDQVVRLLAASEEALMVFAQIETQQDVANFNQRFQADLKLPEQVA
jgi:hypothetical protein